jgi:WD40 repeat protein
MNHQTRFRAALLLALSLSLLVGAARAADPPARKGVKVALVVGINKYHHADLNKPFPLEFAEADARDLADLLKKAGYQVTRLTGDQAKLDAIRAALERLRQVPGDGGIFLVALAGHGIQPRASKEAFFVPYDAARRVLKPGEEDQQPFDEKTMLPFSEVLGHLKASSAEARALLVDACRNDPARAVHRGVGSGLRMADLPDNTFMLLSCSAGQVAYEHESWGGGHGAFFWQVLEGLRGKAADGKGRMTADGLYAHVRDAVPPAVAEVTKGEKSEGKKQVPFRLIVGDVDLGIDAASLPAVAAPGSDYDLTGGYRFAHFGRDGIKVVLPYSFNEKQGFAGVYDVETGKALIPSLKHDAWVSHASFSPDGRRVVTATYEAARPRLTFGSGPDESRPVAIAGEARVWDAQTGRALTAPLKHGDGVSRASFSPDGRRVVTASADGTARVWDAQTGEALTPPLKHGDRVYDASFSPDGRRVVTASADKTARVWDVQTGKPLTPPLKHGDEVWRASFSPDGRQVVTASGHSSSVNTVKPQPGEARVWDARTGEAPTPPLKHDALVGHASFSPDGRWVVTASADRTARVWDARTAKALTPPLKHDSWVWHASFSPDGRRVVTATNEAARVWDAQTGEALTPPLKHDVWVSDASFSPDGRRVVTSNSNGKAWVWDVQTGKERYKVTITPD